MILLKISFNPQRILYTAIVSGAVLIVTGIMLFIVQARPVTAHALAVVGGGGPIPVEVTPKAPIQEVHMANNGMMLLRGASVVSITSDIIRVSMEFGTSHFTWQIENNSGTKFISSNGAAETRDDIKVGDTVTITGSLLQGGSEPTVHATYIRE